MHITLSWRAKGHLHISTRIMSSYRAILKDHTKNALLQDRPLLAIHVTAIFLNRD